MRIQKLRRRAYPIEDRDQSDTGAWAAPDWTLDEAVSRIASVADSLPKEINSAMEELGLNGDDLKGVVRSVTYRARKTGIANS